MSLKLYEKGFQLTDATKLLQLVSQWGLLSLIKYHVSLRVGGQDQPTSQSSSRSFENLISTEVENH